MATKKNSKKEKKPAFMDQEFTLDLGNCKDVKVEARYYTPRKGRQGVNITLAGCLAVRGVWIVNGNNGPFVSMPSYQDADGEYHEYVFPVTANLREDLYGKLIELSAFSEEEEEDEEEE